MNKRITEALKRFLAERRKTSGGYAPFTERDERQFETLMRLIANAKFDRDPDGDFPIEWTIINRTKQERMGYIPLPYLHKLETIEQVIDYLTCAQINVSIANDHVRRSAAKLRDMTDKEGGIPRGRRR